MKKLVFTFLFSFMFFGFNYVNAATVDFTYVEFESELSGSKKEFVDEKISILKDHWEMYYKDSYPYYYISFSVYDHTHDDIYDDPDYVFEDYGGFVNLIMLSSIPSSYKKIKSQPSYMQTENGFRALVFKDDSQGYWNKDILFTSLTSDATGIFAPMYYFDSVNNENYTYGGWWFFDSNFNLTFDLSDSYRLLRNGEVVYQVNPGEPLLNYKQIFGYTSSYDGNYVSIDLNEYSYVALALKDYSDTTEFYTNMYVTGNLCLTPVYNYGSTEKKDVISGSQVQGCTPYYSEETLVRTYILSNDIKNKSIYYLKPYDRSKTNIIRVDSSVFDITYITEENKDNPIVSIGGKDYPTLSFDDLTDTSNKSEDEGYIPGVSCPVGDLNCYDEYNSSNIFKDLFDKPLEMLKTVWSAILSIFALITEFIALLPSTMQGFLYFAFAIGIILGIVKILL